MNLRFDKEMTLDCNRNPKALLASNSNDFDTAEIKEVLANAGITKYLSRTEYFLGWYNAQASHLE